MLYVAVGTWSSFLLQQYDNDGLRQEEILVLQSAYLGQRDDIYLLSQEMVYCAHQQ